MGNTSKPISVLLSVILGIGAGIATWMCINQYAPHPAPTSSAAPRTSEYLDPLPVEHALHRYAGDRYQVGETVSYQEHRGHILVGKDGLRVLAMEKDGYLLLGNLIDRMGVDISSEMASRHRAKTFLAALVDGVRRQASNTGEVRPAQKESSAGNEIDITGEAFEAMLQLPHVSIINPDRPVGLIIFTWQDCHSCKGAKIIVNTLASEIGFGVVEIPIAGGSAEERRAMERLKGLDMSDEDKRRGIAMATDTVHKLLGRLATPTFAWKMPDGTCRFGFINGKGMIERFRAMSQANGNEPVSGNQH